MATQYTPILQLALPVTGELNGTWGDVVNDNITSMVEEAIAGLATISTWTANSHTLTTVDGLTDEARCAMIVAQTGAGGTALTAAGEIICPARTKLYVVSNQSAYQVTIKTAAGTGIAVAAGDTTFVFCDGTNVLACVTQITNGHITGNLTVDGNTTLGNATSDTVTVTGTVTSNLIFTDNTYDIGASGATRPRNLFLSGNATVGGNTTLGDATSDTVTVTARVASDLNPSADNTYDLGTAGNSWRNLYIDGTATIATLNVTTIDTTNLEVTNIKAKDGTAAITLADSTGVATLTANPVLNGGTANGVAYLNGSKVLTTGGSLTFDGTTLTSGTHTIASGNLAFTGTGNRITGDFSNATLTNRVAFQTSTTNAGTALTVIPNGTGSAAQLNLESDANQANGVSFQILANTGGTECRLQSGIRGTGTYLPMTFYTGGSERMRIDTSGNVGIGTTSPLSALSVNGSSGITMQRSTDNAFGGVLDYLKSRGSSASPTNVQNGDSLFLQRVAPYSGSFTYLNMHNIAVDGAFTSGQNPPTRHEFYTNAANGSSTERMRIDSSGNVGIGTISPSYKLDVTSTGSTTNETALRISNPYTSGSAVAATNMLFGYHTSTAYRTAAKIEAGQQTAGTFALGYLAFSTQNSDSTVVEAMRIDSSGNVGIGTNSPVTKLDIATNGNVTGGNIILGSKTNLVTKFSAITSEQYSSTTYPEGYVLIGGTSDNTNNQVYIGGFLNEVNSATVINFYTATNNTTRTGTERMRINASGNVSINTQSAFANLTVNNKASGSIGDALWLSNDQSVNGSGAALAFGNAGTLKHKIACGTYGSDYMSLQTWNGSSVTQRMKLDTDVTTYSTNFYVTTAGGNGMFKVMSAGGDIIQAYQNRDGTSPYFYFNTSGTYGVFSDSRLKDDIIPLDGADAVSFVMGLGPVEFNWREQYGDSTKRISGFLAQDALAAAVTEGQKNALTNWETYDENDPDCEFLGLSEQRILPSVVGALKVALTQISELKAELDATKAEVAALKGA